MNAYVHQAQLLLARLSPREQRLVGLFGALLAIVLVWSLVIAPVIGAPDRMRREIDGLRSELSEIDGLARQLRQAEADAPKGGPATKTPADFSLLSFVEKAAGSSLRPETIASMSPSRRALDGGRQESTVELKLSAVTLGETVALLRAIERERSPVYIRQFSVRKRYDDASHYDVSVLAAATLEG